MWLGYKGGYSWHGLTNIHNIQDIHNIQNIQNVHNIHNDEAGYRGETVGMVGPIFTIYSILRHIALDQKMERGETSLGIAHIITSIEHWTENHLKEALWNSNSEILDKKIAWEDFKQNLKNNPEIKKTTKWNMNQARRIV